MMAYRPRTVKPLARAPRSAYNRRLDKEPMENTPLSADEIARLERREAEILARLARLKITMSETKALDTLAFKAKLLKEAQDELRRVQDKLAGVSED